jgi:nucleoside-diphosphate-sugar epimerase
VGLRLARHLKSRYRIAGTCRTAEQAKVLREAGVRPVLIDLDHDRAMAKSLTASLVVHLMPPPAEGQLDLRSRRLMRIVRGVKRMVYISTSGVYGDCAGALIDEVRRVKPQSGRAARRVDAENFLRERARTDRFGLSILRVPGIYAADRLPVERLRRGTPMLASEDDVYTNHIHADDLVQAIEACLMRGRPMRVYHASDNCPMLTSEYFEQVAAALGVAAPARLPRALLAGHLSPMQASFMQESRRLSNARLRTELRVNLRYPSVAAALLEIQSIPRDSVE